LEELDPIFSFIWQGYSSSAYFVFHIKTNYILIDEDVEEGQDSWAILTYDDNGYPKLPERPLDSSLRATKRMVREFAKAVHSEILRLN
jgi:hypothetical protein